jgi:hypothetical protein
MREILVLNLFSHTETSPVCLVEICGAVEHSKSLQGSLPAPCCTAESGPRLVSHWRNVLEARNVMANEGAQYFGPGTKEREPESSLTPESPRRVYIFSLPCRSQKRGLMDTEAAVKKAQVDARNPHSTHQRYSGPELQVNLEIGLAEPRPRAL